MNDKYSPDRFKPGADMISYSLCITHDPLNFETRNVGSNSNNPFIAAGM
jgi:hypothetical protein